MIRAQFWKIKHSGVRKDTSPFTIANDAVKAFENASTGPSKTRPVELKIMHAMKMEPRVEKIASAHACRGTSFFFLNHTE